MNAAPKMIATTKKWILEFVIGLQLCPFASEGFFNNLVAYQYSEGLDLKTHLSSFWELVTIMLNREGNYISNSFLIMDKDLNYDGLLQLSSICQEFLVEADLEVVFQIVEFHPDLIFGDHEEKDASHFINRSPFPMLHILRVEEVSDAIESYPDIESVPSRNMEKMEKIGYESLKKGLEKYLNMK